jgi:type IV pilus assembly protein PilM
VPDIVKFEAVQQIPFPIDEVEWDYQTFTSKDSPEIEVGIFAITRERVQQRLGLYGEVGMSPEVMTLSPVSVYNAMAYDHANTKHDGPVVYLDIGTQATDVIVAEAGRCWIRTFPLGGTHFTEAIANAFKLSYSKAEKLKLEASDSKYAKQIMQAMRPVFSDLLQDLQRSIGYYNSLHRESELKLMVGVGSTFKIPGLRKFLGQQLQIDVLRLDEYKRIAVTGREAAAFAENAVNMATAYGLALQGVGLAPINANLVPVKALRDQMWHSKTKWFAAAAAVAMLGSAMLLYRPITDRARMEPSQPGIVKSVLERGKLLQTKFEELKTRSDVGSTALNMVNLFDYRSVWPHVLNDTASALASAGPQPELLTDNIEAILKIDPPQRNIVQLDSLTSEYLPAAQANAPRRIRVTLQLELSHEDPVKFVNETVAEWLRTHKDPSGERAGVPYKIVSVQPQSEKLDIVQVTEKGEEGQRQASGPGAGGPRPNVPTPAGPRSTPPMASGRGGGGPAADRGAGKVTAAPGGAMSGGPALGGVGPGGTQFHGSGTDNDGGSKPSTTGYAGSGTNTSAEQVDLDKIAPVPDKPMLYKPGSTFYKIPISFEIELIDPHAPVAPIPNSTAGAQGNQGAAS